MPFRNSILNDPEVQKGVTLPKEWFQSVLDAGKISKLGLPVIIPVAEFRDLVGAAVTATLSGADPATELKKAHEQFRPILERSEKVVGVWSDANLSPSSWPGLSRPSTIFLECGKQDAGWPAQGRDIDRTEALDLAFRGDERERGSTAMYLPDHFRVEDVPQMHALMRGRPFAALVS